MDDHVAFNEKIFYKTMNTKPLLSVICVSMNHEPFIERSFLSLINQTFRDFEILYIDNNSSDKSFDIADQIFKNSGLAYQHFRREKNYLLSPNLNLLLQQATGEYVAFLSGDDFLELTNFEEKMNYYLANPQFGMLYGGGYKYYYDTGKTVLMDNALWKSGWIFKDLLSLNFINSIGVIIKKSTFDDIGFFDENSKLEDWDMWLRIAQKYPIGLLEKPLVYYGRSTGTNTSANTPYMDEGVAYIFNKYAQYKDINKAKRRYMLFRVYEVASEKPTIKNFKFIVKNCQFNIVYFKQVLKFFLGLVGFKKQAD